MLSGFLRHEYFPPELLKGTLEGEEVPVLVTVALPPDDERKVADTWSALGGELKPSLDVVVTAPMNIARSIEAGPPVLEEPRLAVVPAEPAESGGSDRGSRSRKGAPAAGPETRDRPPATVPTPSGPEGDRSLPDETFTAGAASAPGRRIHLRAIKGR
jgi:hypothetical protein